MSNQKEDKNKSENNIPDINSSEEKKERPVITLSNPNIKAIKLNKDNLINSQNGQSILNNKLVDNNANFNIISNIQNENEKNSSKENNDILLNIKASQNNNSFLKNNINESFDNINYKKQGKEENKKNGFNQKPSQSNPDKIDKLIDAIYSNTQLTGQLLRKQEKTISLLSILVQSIIEEKKASWQNANNKEKK